MAREINQAGVDLIKQFEGLGDGDPHTPQLEPYLCPARVATIGYGHALVCDGRQLAGAPGLAKAKTLYPDGITRAEAEALLRADLVRFTRAVEAAVKVELSDNEFAALVSLAFNIGERAFAQSSLVRLLNSRCFADAADQFSAWVVAGGKRLPGLARRRQAEQALFLSPPETR